MGRVSKAAIFIFLVLGSATHVAHAFTLAIPTRINGWQRETLTFHINSTGCGISEDRLNTAVDAAINLWNGVPTSWMTLSRGAADTTTTYAVATAGQSAGTPREPVIYCDTSFTTNIGSTTTPATEHRRTYSNATPSVGIDFFTVADYISINATPGAPGNVANSGMSDTSLALLVAHEIGHVLGLGHSSDSSSIMSYDHSSYDSAVELRLSQDDVDGITYLYPRNEGSGDGKVFGCASIQPVGPSGPSGRGGSGRGAAAEFAGVLAIAGAAVVMLRRRTWLRASVA